MIRENERSLTVAESPEQVRPGSVETTIHGSVLVLIQFDVCEEIKLDELRQIFGARTLEHPASNTLPQVMFAISGRRSWSPSSR